jgi:hypothetical protein
MSMLSYKGHSIQSCVHRVIRTAVVYAMLMYTVIIQHSLPPQKSHLPSFHPVRHLSSHLLQSNSFLPNLTLTALCASHIHCPNSLLELTLGVFVFIHAWKSSAHTQHGYSLPNVFMNVAVSPCSSADGATGYCAVIECSSVQELRPSAAESGGQSRGILRFVLVAPPMAKSELTSLQVRHLGECQSIRVHLVDACAGHGGCGR